MSDTYLRECFAFSFDVYTVEIFYKIEYNKKDNISSGRSAETYRQCLGSHIEYPGGTLGG